MSWETKMYAFSVIGCFFGIFWTTIYAWIAYLFQIVGPPDPPGLRGARTAWSWAGALFVLILLVALASAVVCLLNYLVLIGDDEYQAKLRALGKLAYVTAFSYGFSLAAIVAAPFKN